MPFKPGESGNPEGNLDRDPANGRLKALHTLDKILSKPDNLEKLMGALERRFKRNPYHFFKFVICPLLPKTRDQNITIEGTTPTNITPDSIVRAMDALTTGMDTLPRKRLRLREDV